MYYVYTLIRLHVFKRCSHTKLVPYHSSYLLPDRSHAGKRKTSVVRGSTSPVWREELAYERVNLEQLSRERVLEVTVWDYNRGSSNRFIGGLRLGPFPIRSHKKKEWMDCIGAEVAHWEGMLAHPSQWVEQWHTLRPSMEPRDVDFSALDESTISFPPPITEVEEESGSPTSPAINKMLSISAVDEVVVRENVEEEKEEVFTGGVLDPSALFQSTEVHVHLCRCTMYMV